jgi:hypothetical protein
MMSEGQIEEQSEIDYIERLPDSDTKDFWRAVRADDRNKDLDFLDRQFALNAIEHLPNDLDIFLSPFGRDITTEQLRKAFKKVVIYKKMVEDFGVKIDDAVLDRWIEARRPNKELTDPDKLDIISPD